MQMLELKAKLKNKERVLGTMVTVFQNPDIAKILKECGYDFSLLTVNMVISLFQRWRELYLWQERYHFRFWLELRKLEENWC